MLLNIKARQTAQSTARLSGPVDAALAAMIIKSIRLSAHLVGDIFSLEARSRANVASARSPRAVLQWLGICWADMIGIRGSKCGS
ncbi:unnamed protein product [Colias eurytheme]|nr:unnamed protein product [Colias eurytheme]